MSRDEPTPIWKIVGGAIAVVFIVIVLAWACSTDHTDPAQDDHARTCLQVTHGTVQKHGQFGGKYTRNTYWCVDRDGRITDIWFDS